MSIPPSKSVLPESIDARKLVQREQTFDGILPLESLARLSSAVESVDGHICIQLQFGRNLQGHRVVSGKLQLTVDLLCQRCLKPVREHIEAEFGWGIVWTEEQGKALSKDLDPVIQDGDELDLYPILEDEILLNLPMVAYHQEECVSKESFRFGDETTAADEQQANPFKVLEQLKGSSGKS
ncbi:YceD family protein [Microbulbifer sp. OS29]|uniref:Large ribosomal RNA subunit accumulation protein YceD n=1 Tax=Microbulbifer okhotskensis TaxID=2926617 RepID=A0A9X2EQV9_9GAMM|nr:YceD family protein [Microbulbifer okhotskensis]MCO1333996.1 YceD family protein [Microbulbifer okhotskensis]